MARSKTLGLAQTTAVSTPSAMDLIKINDDFTMTATKIEEEPRKEVVPRFPLDEEDRNPKSSAAKTGSSCASMVRPCSPANEIDPRFTPSSTRWQHAAANKVNTIIEAHTDNVSFRALFSSNSDLSTAGRPGCRITSVQRLSAACARDR